ncbi:hypothetical protein RB595_006053 [Gaeumannomyces hyphopodioides]
MLDASLRAAQVVARLEKEEGKDMAMEQETPRAVEEEEKPMPIEKNAPKVESEVTETKAETEPAPTAAAAPSPSAIPSEASEVKSEMAPAPTPPPTAPLPPVPTHSRPGTARSDTSAASLPTRLPQLAPIPSVPAPRLAPLRGNPAAIPEATIPRSTKRLSFSSLETSKRLIKFGKGKYAKVELVPQPSDDPDDPLNWPMWKKDSTFGALLMSVALAGVMKTALVPVNVQLEQSFNRSYTAIAALTGVPLLLGALSGMVALVAARVWGKRPLYIAGMLTMFLGCIINTAAQDYGTAMAARVFQGIGWGVFDSLVLGTIHDVYFEHEHGLRLAIHQVVSVGTTWGGPLLGGVASMNPGGFRVQFQILCAFQAISSLLVAFAAPETVYDRSFVFLNTPSTAASYQKQQQQLKPLGDIDVEAVKEYLGGMQPHSYRAVSVTKDLLLQAPRAMIAPTTLLLLLVTFLPFSALWAVAGTLSMLFAHLPFELTPASIGALLTGPFLLGAGTAAFFSLAPWWRSRQSLAPMNVLAVAAGSFLVFVSLLGAGLHAESAMMAPMVAMADQGMVTAADAAESSPFMVGGFAGRLSFPGLGVLLALLGAGVYAVDAAVRPMIAKSTQFTSSNLGVALRNTVDMESTLVLARSALAGVFVIAAPSMASAFGALRSALVGFGVSQLCVAGAVGAVWWLWGQDVLLLDGHVMKCIDLSSLRRTGSFFDTD